MDSTRVTLPIAYVNTVLAVGGIPFIFPNKPENAADYFNLVNGILFSGGGDIHSKHYNQPLHEKADGISESRDEFELRLMKMCREAKKPVMGICRGHQLLNVALGGDLIQHIDNHRQNDNRSNTFHNVEIIPGTKLHKWLGKTDLLVNSLHHQGIGRLGEGLIATAGTKDGTNEGVEYTGGDWFCYSVQWHPESMLESPEHILQLELFKPFIIAAIDYKLS
jgi:putative glutamine amidotransferase